MFLTLNLQKAFQQTKFCIASREKYTPKDAASFEIDGGG